MKRIGIVSGSIVSGWYIYDKIEKERNYRLNTFIEQYCAPDNSGKKVCIVGAGVIGITSAYELLNNGYDVTVVE